MAFSSQHSYTGQIFVKLYSYTCYPFRLAGLPRLEDNCVVSIADTNVVMTLLTDTIILRLEYMNIVVHKLERVWTYHKGARKTVLDVQE